MMVAKVHSSYIVGVEALKVEIEVYARSGSAKFSIIGLGDNAIRESRERIASAIRCNGVDPPEQILVNLAPAELRKEGSSFDLGIALGILIAAGALDQRLVDGVFPFGELALDGTLKPIKGIVSLAFDARARDARLMIVPRQNLREASLIEELDVVGVSSLREVLGFLRGQLSRDELEWTFDDEPQDGPVDNRGLGDVKGQAHAKHGLLLAACGGHNLLMVGPPGCGKSMLAERLPLLLPPLSYDERFEVARVHSVAGIALDKTLRGVRPFRAPHHSVSEAGLVGGGSKLKPGELSLAHRGVLFLDEFPEFHRSALEALRGPLETQTVQLARARGAANFPADVQVVAAMNPCPCGRLGSSECGCPRGSIARYLGRLSQPILDRLDIHLQLEPVKAEDVLAPHAARDADDACADKVLRARATQLQRQGCLNARLTGAAFETHTGLDEPMRRFFVAALEKLGISARGMHRILRVARTAADVEGTERIEQPHLAAALSFRSLQVLTSYVGG